MDPNEALRQIREEVTRVREDGDAEAFALADLIVGLDDWLSRDGFLPDDWRSDDEKAGRS